MGRGDHADVDGVGPVAADRTHLAELQHAQELRLQAEGHVADLVEQERPAVRLRQQAPARLDGAGERAAHVAEHLRLEELVRDGGGVHRDERPARAGAPRAWIARATSSLPTPVSPVMRTGALDAATRPMSVAAPASRARCRRAPRSRSSMRRARARRPLDVIWSRSASAAATAVAQLVHVVRLRHVLEGAVLDGVNGVVNLRPTRSSG